MQLIARQASANTRAYVQQKVLGNISVDLSYKLHTELNEIQATWKGGLARLLAQF
jgi:hypothetical protein